MPLQYFQMILKQIMYQLIKYVAWKKKKKKIPNSNCVKYA